MTKSANYVSKKLISKLPYLATAISLAAISTSLIANVLVGSASAYSQSVSAAPGHHLSLEQDSQMQGRFNRSLAGTSTFSSNPSIGLYNWSGYAVTAPNSFNEAKTVYTQPTSTCTTTGAWTLFWTGLDGYNGSTVEQAGTSAECLGTSTQPIYYAWWEMYPTNTVQKMPIAIHAGDVIQASVNYNTTNGVYSLAVSDQTDGQAFTEQTTCAANLVCSRSSAEWIVERPSLGGSYTVLADWGSMSLTGDEASDSIITTYSGHGRHATKIVSNVLQPINSFSNTPINMIAYPYTGATLATVGPLDQTGTQFNDTWQAAQ